MCVIVSLSLETWKRIDKSRKLEKCLQEGMGKREETVQQDEMKVLGFVKILVSVVGCFVLDWVREKLKLFGLKATPN